MKPAATVFLYDRDGKECPRAGFVTPGLAASAAFDLYGNKLGTFSRQIDAVCAVLKSAPWSNNA